MIRITSILIFTIALSGCSTSKENNLEHWRLVYQNDFNGRPKFGSVNDLISLMKQGEPIRVAWGGTEADGSSWIEFAEPDFTTVMNDSAVFVQFPLSFIQTHYTDPSKSWINTDMPAGWRAMMGTTGRYHQFHYDFQSGKITRVMYCRTTVSWFARQTISDENLDEPDLTPQNSFVVDSIRVMSR